MIEEFHKLLGQLEELNAHALEQASQNDLTPVAQTVRERGEVLQQLQAALAEAGPMSYTEWNRLVVIHYQGNRIGEAIEQARTRLALEVVECSREQALLGCVAAIVDRKLAPELNETA